MVSKIELIYRAKTKNMDNSAVRYYMKLQSYLIYIQRLGKIKRIHFDFEDYKVFEEKMREAIESCQSSTTKEVLVSILNNDFTYIRNGANDIYKQLLECNNKELREAFKIESLMGPILSSGNYITEDCLSELVIKLHEGRSNKKIIDLCSGKGQFLAMAANSYRDSELFGVEMILPNVIESRMLLDMMSAKYSALCEDLFSISCAQDYDLVFSDFPWHMVTHQDICEDKDGIFTFENIKGNTNWAFAGKAINSINENGRAYVLMPTGALNSTLDEKIRKQVIDKGLLEMSISLPAATRLCTNIDYSLLVFSKGNESVKMVDATSFCTKGSKKKLKVNDIINAINNNSSEYVKIIDNSTIIENSYKLNSQLYFMEKIIVPHARQLRTIAETFRGIQYSSKQ